MKEPWALAEDAHYTFMEAGDDAEADRGLDAEKILSRRLAAAVRSTNFVDETEVVECLSWLMGRDGRGSNMRNTKRRRSKQSRPLSGGTRVVTLLLQLMEKEKETLTRKQLRASAELFSKAASAALLVELSSHASRFVDSEDQFSGLSSILGTYSKRLELLVARGKGSARGHVSFNLTLASLLAHVKVRAGGYRHAEVSRLVEAVIGREFSTREWQKQHRDLLRVAETREASRRRAQ